MNIANGVLSSSWSWSSLMTSSSLWSRLTMLIRAYSSFFDFIMGHNILLPKILDRFSYIPILKGLNEILRKVPGRLSCKMTVLVTIAITLLISACSYPCDFV